MNKFHFKNAEGGAIFVPGKNIKEEPKKTKKKKKENSTNLRTLKESVEVELASFNSYKDLNNKNFQVHC